MPGGFAEKYSSSPFSVTELLVNFLMEKFRLITSLPAIACSKLTIETLEQGVK